MYLQEFSGKQDIVDRFEIDEKVLAGAKILLAWYGYGCYCGSALVVFLRGGKLYEVNASHCSCWGIEGQWSPEETSPEALLKREIYDEYDGHSEAQEKLHALARKLLKQNLPLL